MVTIEALERITQQTAAASEETSAASEQLSAQAEELAATVGTVRLRTGDAELAPRGAPSRAEEQRLGSAGG